MSSSTLSSSSASSLRFPKHHAKPGSLGFALLGAASLIEHVARGHSLQSSLPALTHTWRLDAADRGAIQAITFHTLRHWAQARAIRETLLPKPKPKLLGHLLETALALTWPEDAPLYPAHSLVSQAVEAAKQCDELRMTAAVVNAVLRRWQRERQVIQTQMPFDEAAQLQHPSWWLERLKAIYPNQYKSVCQQNLSKAGMTLRVYTEKSTIHTYLGALRGVGIEADVLSLDALVLHQAVPVEKLPRFDEGVCSVQDFGAQLAAHWLGAKDGDVVLDACSAPGGKTAHILERAKVQLLALDSDAQRLERVAQNLKRIGLKATLKHADASKPETWWDGKPLDRILLDAPCSASGIVRRHPDILWLRRPSDIDALAQQQAILLKKLWPLLKPGGTLLYCTCSVFPEEGEQQTTAFLANTPDAKAIALDLSPFESKVGHNLHQDNSSVLKLTSGVQLLPVGATSPFSESLKDRGAKEVRTQITHDGFYYALLQKIGVD